MARTQDRPDTPDTPDTRNDLREGQTTTRQNGESSPRLPHERDQSADSQTPPDGQPTEVGRQAHEDVESGLVDTDRGPVMDRLRKKLAP